MKAAVSAAVNNKVIKIMAAEVMQVKRLSEFATIPTRGSIHAAGRLNTAYNLVHVHDAFMNLTCDFGYCCNYILYRI